MTRDGAVGLVAAVLMLATAVGAQDKRTYYTVQHPDKFWIDWISFYDNVN